MKINFEVYYIPSKFIQVLSAEVKSWQNSIKKKKKMLVILLKSYQSKKE